MFHQHTNSVSIKLVAIQNNCTDFNQVIANSNTTESSNSRMDGFFVSFLLRFVIYSKCFTAPACHLDITLYHLLRKSLSLLRFRTDQQQQRN